MNRSPLGVIDAAGNPTGAAARGPNDAGSVILLASYRSRNRCGAVGGLCGLVNPQARKKRSF